MYCDAMLAMGDIEIAACFNIMTAQCSACCCLYLIKTLGPLLISSLFMSSFGCLKLLTHERLCVCGSADDQH